MALRLRVEVLLWSELPVVELELESHQTIVRSVVETLIQPVVLNLLNLIYFEVQLKRFSPRLKWVFVLEKNVLGQVFSSLIILDIPELIEHLRGAHLEFLFLTIGAHALDLSIVNSLPIVHRVLIVLKVILRVALLALPLHNLEPVEVDVDHHLVRKALFLVK